MIRMYPYRAKGAGVLGAGPGGTGPFGPGPTPRPTRTTPNRTTPNRTHGDPGAIRDVGPARSGPCPGEHVLRGSARHPRRTEATGPPSA